MNVTPFDEFKLSPLQVMRRNRWNTKCKELAISPFSELERMDKPVKLSIDVSSRASFRRPDQPPLSTIFGIFSKGARTLSVALIFATFAWPAPCQEIPGTEPAQPDRQRNAEHLDNSEQESHRILGIIPNYRTSPSLVNYKPLTTEEKFKIASEDSLDRGTFALAGLFAGLGQLTNDNKSFGQGSAGFARYFGASYGDMGTS